MIVLIDVYIIEFTASGTVLARFCALLFAAGMEPQVVPSSEIQSVLWTKLLVNAGINPLAAILNVRNQVQSNDSINRLPL